VALALVSGALPGVARAAGDAAGASDLVWRVLNLALLLGVLYAFARKPIQAWFGDRRQRIQGELASAAQLRREAEERLARWQRRLAELEDELAGIRATARERAEAERERILADARAAAERIRGDARAAVDQELRRAREELREEVADLSVQLAGDLLRGHVADSDRDRMLDEFIARVESAPANGGGS
jgi:F-type H+-transporting ATPase subunit b